MDIERFIKNKTISTLIICITSIIIVIIFIITITVNSLYTNESVDIFNNILILKNFSSIILCGIIGYSIIRGDFKQNIYVSCKPIQLSKPLPLSKPIPLSKTTLYEKKMPQNKD